MKKIAHSFIARQEASEEECKNVCHLFSLYDQKKPVNIDRLS